MCDMLDIGEALDQLQILKLAHKVRKKANVKNQYNQIPHQDTILGSDKTQINITYKAAKSSPLSKQVIKNLQ